MSDTMNNQQPNNSTPEDIGGQGRTFTQEEVNRIVSDRLAREREKMNQPKEDERETALKIREARLDCREYLDSKKYPAALLEVLDTSDADKFKAAVDNLVERLPSVLYQVKETGPNVPHPPQQENISTIDAQLKEIFKPKI